MQNKGLSVSQQGSSSVHTLPLQDQQPFNQPPLITSSFQCVHLHRRGWTSPQTNINPGAWPRSLSRSWMSANGEEKKKKTSIPFPVNQEGRGRGILGSLVTHHFFFSAGSPLFGAGIPPRQIDCRALSGSFVERLAVIVGSQLPARLSPTWPLRVCADGCLKAEQILSGRNM